MAVCYDATADCEYETTAASTVQPIEIDDSEWDTGMKQWYESCNSLRLMVVGRTGHGKSSFINAMFCMEEAEVAALRDPTTKSVKEYNRDVNGVTLSLFDSPGLQDGNHKDEDYIKDMKETCKAVNLMLYCIRMDDQLREKDEENIKAIAKAMGNDIWKHAVCVLTFANNVRPTTTSHGEPMERFNKIFCAMKEKARRVIYDTSGYEVPVVASGNIMDYKLPVCIDWRRKVLVTVIEKCSNEGAIALLRSNWRLFSGLLMGLRSTMELVREHSLNWAKLLELAESIITERYQSHLREAQVREVMGKMGAAAKPRRS